MSLIAARILAMTDAEFQNFTRELCLLRGYAPSSPHEKNERLALMRANQFQIWLRQTESEISRELGPKTIASTAYRYLPAKPFAYGNGQPVYITAISPDPISSDQSASPKAVGHQTPPPIKPAPPKAQLKRAPPDRETRILSDQMKHTEVAAQLGISPRTLDRWAALGEGPPRIKVGRQIFYRRASVRAWLEARERVSAV